MMGLPPFDDANTALLSSSKTQFHHRNVFSLLARREISPRTKCCPRWPCGEASKQKVKFSSGPQNEAVIDARRGLLSWVEADSLQHLSAKYCPLAPPPRSTIAASFSPDGKNLASTHGDHTVKIIDCQTGTCLKVLIGHRRTPWVVRFHPQHEEILASGSLDHEVRLWHAITSECIGSRDFYRPIASIAFHMEGEVLAVASGHKLYMWLYNGKGEISSPTIVLKTRRSLRAVHFHPHGAPLLLTAEVNDLDSSDSSLTHATSAGSLHYPPPAVYVANLHPNDNLCVATDVSLMAFPLLYIPSFGREHLRSNLVLSGHHIEAEQSGSMGLDTQSTEHYECMELSPAVASSSLSVTDGTLANFCPTGIKSAVVAAINDMETFKIQLVEGHSQSSISESGQGTGSISHDTDRVSNVFRQRRFRHSREPACWELPFLQGWLMGQSQASMPSGFPRNDGSLEDSHGFVAAGSAMLTSDLPACYKGIPVAPLAIPSNMNSSMLAGGSGEDDQSTRNHPISMSNLRPEAASDSASHDRNHSLSFRIQSELAASLAATAAAELPCTVKLKLWSHNVKSPCDPLEAERCLLTVPHAVLCSEVGAHFSPCGKFLAACVACVLPQVDSDPGLLTLLHQDVSRAGSSPTRPPVSAHKIMYELRVYSLEEATFGLVLASRAIRAAHCLTAIQFSPTSEHILLAYGRRHSSLLESIIINGESSIPVYTVLEVYRVSDMELVSVLPSADDEINVASFHPSAGGGLVYGTKEGKLRILRYDRSNDMAKYF